MVVSMYVEDILAEVALRLIDDTDPINDRLGDRWWRKFAQSVAMRVEAGIALTTAQAKYVIQLIEKVGPTFVADGHMTDHQLKMLLLRPNYRNELLETIEVSKEVRVLAGNMLGFRTKMYPEMRSAIMGLGDTNGPLIPYWIPEHRLWVVPLTPDNCKLVADVIGTHGFSYDQQVCDAMNRVIDGSSTVMRAVLHDDHIAINPNGIVVERWIDDVMLGDGFDGYLEATPAVARMLFRMSIVMNLDIDPEIKVLARDPYPLDLDRAATLPEPLMAQQIAAIQYATDMRLRCVFPAASLKSEAMLAAWMNGHVPIVVTNLERRTQWRNAAIDIGIRAEVVDQVSACDPDYQKERRERPIILDMPHVEDDVAEALATEFPSTMMVGNAFADQNGPLIYPMKSIWKHKSIVPKMAAILYPTMPHTAFLSNAQNYETGVSRYGFKSRYPSDLAFMFGVYVPMKIPTADDL